MRLVIRVLGFELLDVDLSDSYPADTAPTTETGIAAVLVAKAMSEREGGAPEDVR